MQDNIEKYINVKEKLAEEKIVQAEAERKMSVPKAVKEGADPAMQAQLNQRAGEVKTM